MRKAEMLAHWEALPPNLPVEPTPVIYKHEGSTYDQDGIRITGSREFIDSVLSRPKDLLRFEDTQTRLQVVYKESVDRESGQAMGTFNCYIQVHERGDEAKMVNAFASGIAHKKVILSRGF